MNKDINSKTEQVEEALDANHYLVEGLTYFVEHIEAEYASMMPNSRHSLFSWIDWRHRVFQTYVEFFAPFMDAEIEHSHDGRCSDLDTTNYACDKRIYFWMHHNQDRDGIRLDDYELDIAYLSQVVLKKILRLQPSLHKWQYRSLGNMNAPYRVN